MVDVNSLGSLLVAFFAGGAIHSLFRIENATGAGFRRMLPWTPVLAAVAWALAALLDAHPRVAPMTGVVEHALAIALFELAVLAGAWVDHLLNDAQKRTRVA